MTNDFQTGITTARALSSVAILDRDSLTGETPDRPALISQHSYDCPYTGVSAHTEHICPWPPNDKGTK